MKINALVKGMSLIEQGWLHDDGDYGNILELMDEEFDESFYDEEEFYDEEDYDEIVLDNLYDLYGLMSKGWSEELNKAIKRAKELGRELGKSFV